MEATVQGLRFGNRWGQDTMRRNAAVCSHTSRLLCSPLRTWAPRQIIALLEPGLTLKCSFMKPVPSNHPPSFNSKFTQFPTHSNHRSLLLTSFGLYSMNLVVTSLSSIRVTCTSHLNVETVITYSMAQQPLKSLHCPLMRVSLSDSILVT